MAAKPTPGEQTVATLTWPQGWISAVLLVDGRREGTWKYEQKGKRLSVEIAPFCKQPAWVKEQVKAEAGRLALYLGGVLDLKWDE